MFSKYGILIIVLTAITPIPYKLSAAPPGKNPKNYIQKIKHNRITPPEIQKKTQMPQSQKFHWHINQKKFFIYKNSRTE